MKTGLLVACLGLGLICAACHREERTSKPDLATNKNATWLTSFEQAQAQARTEKKVLLINFTGSDWCPPCMMLHRQVFSQPEFVDYAAQKLVLLEVDFPHNKEQSAELQAANEELAERYKIYGFPTIILLDPTGKKIGELGYLPGGPDKFIAELDKLADHG